MTENLNKAIDALENTIANGETKEYTDEIKIILEKLYNIDDKINK